MRNISPPGLTAQDFHQPYVNPLDVFPARSRLATRPQTYRSPIRNKGTSRSSSRLAKEHHTFACCEDEDGNADRPIAHSPNALDCCVTFDLGNDLLSFDPPSPACCDEPHHNSPSPMDCEDCVDDCDDCVEEHVKAIQKPCHFIDECEECDDEKTGQCSRGPACQDTCDECDFSCFDCVDWTEFERDKNLGLSFSVPLLDGNGFTQSHFDLQDTEASNTPSFQQVANPQSLAPPVDVPMHHQCYENTVPYWNTLAQDQICTGVPGLSQQLPLPPFSLNFGCHPAVAHQQVLQTPFPTTASYSRATVARQNSPAADSTTESPSGLSSTQDLLSAITSPETSRSCQWLMPCGTVCGASFATGMDLKKHLKSVHLVKGVTKCQWQSCDAADFASEAALTGHISKKHLASMLASASTAHKHKHHTAHGTTEGAFKCTFPSCPKSFTYKHIRDEHVATHHGGNRMYCPICHVYLNGEGSNFKRHMATHRPKHQHMLCRYHADGCKRRFPRLDNLRRHEACCKFGKKMRNEGADGQRVAHHHHHHAHA